MWVGANAPHPEYKTSCTHAWLLVVHCQMVHDLCETNAESPLVPDHQKLLAGCLKLWWDHANRYL